MELNENPNNKEIDLEDLDTFQNDIKYGRLAEAEQWLKDMKETAPAEECNEQWFYEREQELLEAYLKEEKWFEAKRIIEEPEFSTKAGVRQERREYMKNILKDKNLKYNEIEFDLSEVA